MTDHDSSSHPNLQFLIPLQTRCGWMQVASSQSYSVWNEKIHFVQVHYHHIGGSPGLVVMGDASWSRGEGFESHRRIMDWYFSHFLEKLHCLLEKTENKQKRDRDGPFYTLSSHSTHNRCISIGCIQNSLPTHVTFQVFQPKWVNERYRGATRLSVSIEIVVFT